MKIRKVLAAFVSATMLIASTCIPAFAYNKPTTDKFNPQVKFAVESIDSEGYAVISASLTIDKALTEVTTNRGKYTGSAWQQISFSFDVNPDIFDGTEVWEKEGAMTVTRSTTADKPAEGKLIITTPGSTPNTMTQTWADPLFKIEAKLKDTSLTVADVERLVLGTLKTATIEFYEWNGVVAAEADYYGYSYGITGAAAQFNDADERIQFCPNPAPAGPVVTSVAITDSADVDLATATVNGGETLQLKAKVEGTGTLTGVDWTATAGTITADGLFTAPAAAKEAQTITVTATSKDDSTKSDTATITVPAATKVAKTVVINEGAESVNTDAEGNVTLTAVVKDQFEDVMDTTVAWSSDNGDVTVVNGVVTAAIKADPYTATITATAGDASDTIVVNVPAAVKVPSVEAIGAKKTADQNAMYWGVKWSNIASPAWKVTLTKEGVAEPRYFNVNLGGAYDTIGGTGEKAFGFYLKVSNIADKFTFKVEDTNSEITATANTEGVSVEELQ